MVQINPAHSAHLDRHAVSFVDRLDKLGADKEALKTMRRASAPRDDIAINDDSSFALWLVAALDALASIEEAQKKPKMRSRSKASKPAK